MTNDCSYYRVTVENAGRREIRCLYTNSDAPVQKAIHVYSGCTVLNVEPWS